MYQDTALLAQLREEKSEEALSSERLNACLRDASTRNYVKRKLAQLAKDSVPAATPQQILDWVAGTEQKFLRDTAKTEKTRSNNVFWHSLEKFANQGIRVKGATGSFATTKVSGAEFRWWRWKSALRDQRPLAELRGIADGQTPNSGDRAKSMRRGFHEKKSESGRREWRRDYSAAEEADLEDWHESPDKLTFRELSRLCRAVEDPFDGGEWDPKWPLLNVKNRPLDAEDAPAEVAEKPIRNDAPDLDAEEVPERGRECASEQWDGACPPGEPGVQHWLNSSKPGASQYQPRRRFGRVLPTLEC